MSDHDLQQSLAERIEEQTGVDLDPERHIDVENGRATLTEAGARALSARNPQGSTAENGSAVLGVLNPLWDRFWSGVADAINSALAAWAQYEGYGTYALGAYIYTAAAAALTVAFYSADVRFGWWVSGGFALIGLLIGNYYRGAAKRRVTCNQCGEPARGNDECPHCGGPTFMDGGAA